MNHIICFTVNMSNLYELEVVLYARQSSIIRPMSDRSSTPWVNAVTSEAQSLSINLWPPLVNGYQQPRPTCLSLHMNGRAHVRKMTAQIRYLLTKLHLFHNPYTQFCAMVNSLVTAYHLSSLKIRAPYNTWIRATLINQIWRRKTSIIWDHRLLSHAKLNSSA